MKRTLAKKLLEERCREMMFKHLECEEYPRENAGYNLALHDMLVWVKGLP